MTMLTDDKVSPSLFFDSSILGDYSWQPGLYLARPECGPTFYAKSAKRVFLEPFLFGRRITITGPPIFFAPELEAYARLAGIARGPVGPLTSTL
jgi:hypothetical protein